MKYHVTKDFTILSEMHYICYQVFEQPLRLSVTMTNYRTTFFFVSLHFFTYSSYFSLLTATCLSWHLFLIWHLGLEFYWGQKFTVDIDLAHSVICLTRGLDPSPCLCLFPPVSALPCLFLHPTGLQDVLYPQIEFWTFFCKHNTCTNPLYSSVYTFTILQPSKR